MCERHSFCLTRAAKVLDGYGLTDSHTTIMALHGLTTTQQDACNLYEWQPPKSWPEVSYVGGIKVDKETFVSKARHESAIERHLLARYPDRATWEAPDVIRWDALPLPDAERVHRAYDLALRAAPLGVVDDATVLEHVNRHLAMLGCKEAVKIVNAASVWDSVRASVQASVWDSVWASVWDSVWASVRASVWASVWVWASVRDSVWDSVWVWASVRDSVRDSVWASVRASMVRDDADNPWLPLAELATRGCYLYGVANDGTAYVWRKEADGV